MEPKVAPKIVLCHVLAVKSDCQRYSMQFTSYNMSILSVPCARGAARWLLSLAVAPRELCISDREILFVCVFVAVNNAAGLDAQQELEEGEFWIAGPSIKTSNLVSVWNWEILRRFVWENLLDGKVCHPATFSIQTFLYRLNSQADARFDVLMLRTWNFACLRSFLCSFRLWYWKTH